MKVQICNVHNSEFMGLSLSIDASSFPYFHMKSPWACNRKLSDIWYLDTDWEHSNIWEPFDRILIFPAAAPSLERQQHHTGTTRELMKMWRLRNLVLEQKLFDQSPPRSPDLMILLRQRKEFWSRSHSNERKNYIFKIIILNHRRSENNPCDKLRLLRINTLNEITDNYQIWVLVLSL